MGTDTQRWRYKLLANEIYRGAVIAYPTEGVWGLGCLPEDEAAVHRLLSLKRRPWQKGLILLASQIEQVYPYIEPLSPEAIQRLNESWPGATTFLIPASAATPEWIRGSHRLVAFRVTDHPVCRGICDQLGQPLVSTSANPAGRPAAMSKLRVKQYFGNQIDYLVPGKLGGEAGPSEIIDLLSGEVIRASV